MNLKYIFPLLWIVQPVIHCQEEESEIIVKKLGTKFNRSKKVYTYTLMNISCSITPEQLESLKEIKRDSTQDTIFIAKHLLTMGAIGSILQKHTAINPFSIFCILQSLTEYKLNKDFEKNPNTTAITGKEKISIDAFHSDLQKQFPQADFDTMKFKQYSHKTPLLALYPDSFSANSRREIAFNFPAINNIHTIYEKKVDNKLLTQEEQDLLDGYTYAMLHESSHVRNNDVRNHKIVELSTLGALMALSYYYQPKDLLANTVFITISIVTKELAYLAHSRYVEMRADTFANKHATFNQLTQAHKFFLSISDNSKNYMMLKTHPLSIQRALAIENELALRKKSMNNHAVLQLCDKHSS